MAYELRELTGSMFENDRKQQKHQPDWKGSCMIAGKEYWLSAWKKDGRTPWLSLAFTEKLPKDGAPKPAAKGADDDVPF